MNKFIFTNSFPILFKTADKKLRETTVWTRFGSNCQARSQIWCKIILLILDLNGKIWTRGLNKVKIIQVQSILMVQYMKNWSLFFQKKDSLYICFAFENEVRFKIGVNTKYSWRKSSVGAVFRLLFYKIKPNFLKISQTFCHSRVSYSCQTLQWILPLWLLFMTLYNPK